MITAIPVFAEKAEPGRAFYLWHGQARKSTISMMIILMVLSLCERATNRCIIGGKNDQKYGIYPFDKLEFTFE